jgi:hypothetical protein
MLKQRQFWVLNSQLDPASCWQVSSLNWGVYPKVLVLLHMPVGWINGCD